MLQSIYIKGTPQVHLFNKQLDHTCCSHCMKYDVYSKICIELLMLTYQCILQPTNGHQNNLKNDQFEFNITSY